MFPFLSTKKNAYPYHLPLPAPQAYHPVGCVYYLHQ